MIAFGTRSIVRPSVVVKTKTSKDQEQPDWTSAHRRAKHDLLQQVVGYLSVIEALCRHGRTQELSCQQ